jgi:hypothetical protein
VPVAERQASEFQRNFNSFCSPIKKEDDKANSAGEKSVKSLKEKLNEIKFKLKM